MIKEEERNKNTNYVYDKKLDLIKNNEDLKLQTNELKEYKETTKDTQSNLKLGKKDSVKKYIEKGYSIYYGQNIDIKSLIPNKFNTNYTSKKCNKNKQNYPRLIDNLSNVIVDEIVDEKDFNIKSATNLLDIIFDQLHTYYKTQKHLRKYKYSLDKQLSKIIQILYNVIICFVKHYHNIDLAPDLKSN